ncbi:MAG: ABC transporter substrate-binding protein, partial [Chloroflexi bacterium]|nr:ABC transporter substrate-binding protein [Chloroflexota bacterium]
MKSIRVPVSGFSPLLFGAALIVALSAWACLGPANAPEREEGFSEADILFGQTAAFSGPAEALGKGMRLGIEAAFHEANASGGVHGRMLQLKAVDDRYEPGVSDQTTERLINQDRVFALIGAVGTPTSGAASPLANEAGVPFLGPLTGAGFLRDPSLSNVFNIRASYHQETEEMIARLTEDLGITRVGVFHQDDSFGLDGLEGVRLALERRGLEPVDSWDYERNSGTNIRAINDIVAANPEAIIMIGTQDAVATTIKLVNRDILPVFMTVSFVGGEALAQTLGEEGNGVYVTQVVPYPTDAGTPVVARYHAALSSYDAEA